jgi:hypothetical protein
VRAGVWNKQFVIVECEHLAPVHFIDNGVKYEPGRRSHSYKVSVENSFPVVRVQRVTGKCLKKFFGGYFQFFFAHSGKHKFIHWFLHPFEVPQRAGCGSGKRMASDAVAMTELEVFQVKQVQKIAADSGKADGGAGREIGRRAGKPFNAGAGRGLHGIVLPFQGANLPPRAMG